MQRNQLPEAQVTLNFQVSHHSCKKTTKALPKQHVEKKTPNRVWGQAAALLEASSLLCLKDTKAFSDQQPLSYHPKSSTYSLLQVPLSL